MNRATCNLLTAAIAAGLTVSCHAQLSPWSSIPAASPQTTQLEQTLLIVTQGNTVHAWSALSRTWSSITTVFGPPVNSISNEHHIVKDGPVFYGYSPRTSSFQAKFTFSPAAALVPPGSPQTWHSVVVDGNVVHAFFALTGQWMSYPFSSPPTVTPGRFCFLVSAGGNLYAVSSYYGTLVTAPVAGATVAGAWGNLAIAESAGMVHGFSAAKNLWSSMPSAGPVTVANGNAQPAFVALNDGVSLSMFSGHTGGFTTVPVTALAAVTLERYAGVAVEGGVAYGYSALLGTLDALPLAGPATVIPQQMFALVNDGVSTTAFSAAKGAFSASITVAGLDMAHHAQVATLTPSGGTVPALVYSAVENSWIGGPGVASGMTYLTAVSVIVEQTGGGLWGWSHHGTSWVHQPAPVMDAITPGTSPPQLAGTFYARAGTTIYTFNPRTIAWRTMATAAPATLVRAHHHAILAQDGGALYGFNDLDDAWTVQPLAAPYGSGGGQVTSAWATDGVNVYAYSGYGQVSAVPDFPEYFRALTRGCQFRIDVSGEPFSPMILAVAFAPASIPTALGTILIDPATLFVLSQATIPPNGTFGMTLQVPDDPGISGITPHFQSAIAGPSGLYLTGSVFVTVY